MERYEEHNSYCSYKHWHTVAVIALSLLASTWTGLLTAFVLKMLFS